MHRKAIPSALAVVVALLSFGVVGAAAAQELCGRPSAPPAELFARLTTQEKFSVVSRDQNYVVLQDPADITIWTFTVAGHAAHPSVVCRRPVQAINRSWTMHMQMRCGAPEPACKQLLRDFEVLNARMIEDIKRQQR